MCTLVLGDDLPLWTDLLARSLAAQASLRIIGTATTAAQLWAVLRQQQPDLLLLDLMLGQDGKDLSLARQVKQRYPQQRIVLLANASHNARLIQEANRLGLDGFLSKRISEAELIAFLHRAGRGERVFSDDVKDALIQLNQTNLPELTPREKEIMTRLDKGMKRASIVAEMKLKSTNTYDAHVHHIKEKFGARSTSELIRRATELGYV